MKKDYKVLLVVGMTVLIVGIVLGWHLCKWAPAMEHFRTVTLPHFCMVEVPKFLLAEFKELVKEMTAPWPKRILLAVAIYWGYKYYKTSDRHQARRTSRANQEFAQ